MKVFFKTFGCRTNIFDTQVMIESINRVKYELSMDENNADVIIVNSCTVTNGADKDVKEYIKKMNNLNKKILFTGCGLNNVGKEMYEKGRIFGAFGHSKKQNIQNLLEEKERFFLKNDLSHLDSTIINQFVGKSRAFIKIQEGCNFKCSYCIIPQVRGRARSYAKEQILLQVKKLLDSGISEIILSGTNLGSYGKDSGDTLAKLIIDIEKINGIKRIRLGSLEPSQIKEDFIEILDSNILEKHLHIALQNTNNETLKAMQRINRFQKDLILFEKIASKGYALGTDFIVGFPTENDLAFEESLSNLKLLPLTHIHAFIYSPRNNTKASLLENKIPKHISKTRLKTIKNIVSKKNQEFRLKMPKLEVLVERKKGEFFYGLDQYFNRIKIASKKDLSLKWLNIANYNAYEEMNYAEI